MGGFSEGAPFHRRRSLCRLVPGRYSAGERQFHEQHCDGDYRGDIGGLAGGRIQKGKGFGLIGNLVIGILGSVFGSWLFWQLGFVTFGFIGNVVVAVVGAFVILYVVGMIAQT
jgi:uncharacterized membrane protein YeaQ/YmgE (transglycosylase-associated protein family)